LAAESLAATYTPEALEQYMRSPVATSNKESFSVTTKQATLQKIAVQQGETAAIGPRIVNHYEHRGKWGPLPGESCHGWSCCGNSEKDSQGCHKSLIINQHRWNFASK